MTGTAIGAFQGWLVGYMLIPAFIVTLGGLLIWRNVAWYLTNGQTIGPLNEYFLLFGGINGTLGETLSWVFALVATIAALWALVSTRRNKIAHDIAAKPSGGEPCSAS